MDNTDWEIVASNAFQRAYTRCSSFKVGAALRVESGAVFAGFNIENVLLGLTLCAERVALGCAIVAGETAFREIMIVADSDEPIVPYGACRQVLAEFNPDLRIASVTLGGRHAEWSLRDLLPYPRQGILEQK
jgi:cytidine deaminase